MLIIRILLALAVLPAILLMAYIYRKDSIEKEPLGLLILMAVSGAVSCVPASWLERIGTGFLSVLQARHPFSSLSYAAIEAFLIVALAEEGCKLFFLKKLTWNSREFNYRFDGIVFSVFVGLGFAALENILYVFNYGPGVIASRGLLAIPGHMTFAIFMGIFYSQAKINSLYGYERGRRKNMRLSLLVPMLLHGFYDFCLMSGLRLLSLAFFLFVALLDFAALKAINFGSKNDQAL